MAKNGEEVIKVIKGALHYCQVKNPGKSQGGDPQWQVQVEITEDQADHIEEVYPDMARSIKAYKTDKFKDTFGVDPQIEPDAKKHFVVSIKQVTTINGKPFAKPVRVLMVNEDTGKLVDVTQKYEVGNGSTGVVQVRELFSKTYNTATLKLAAVRVDNLIEYIREDDLSELGEIDESSFEDANYGSAETKNDSDGFDDEPDFGDQGDDKDY